MSEIERSLPHIQLDSSQLLTLVRKAFPACQKIDDWKILSGGAVNTTYKLQIGKEAFVLRLYTRDRSHSKTEKEIYRLLDGKVPTPKLLYTDEEAQPWAYSIFEWISGVHLSSVSQDHKTSLSFELGRILTSIHAFKFTQGGLFGVGMEVGNSFEVGSSPYFEETLSVLSKGKKIRHRLGEELARQTVYFIQKNKDFFPKVENNICLTHADFKPVNLLYDAEGKVFVLDWEFAHAGIGLLDFAILLRHRDQFPCDLKALEEGYTTFGGSLPDEWFRSALITDLMNMVTLMDSPSEQPNLYHQLRTIIQTTINC